MHMLMAQAPRPVPCNEHGVPICPIKDCKERACWSPAIVFKHQCNSHECTVEEGAEDGVIVPVVFCENHCPPLGELLESQEWRSFCSGAKGGGYPIPKEVRVHWSHIYEENLGFH